VGSLYSLAWRTSGKERWVNDGVLAWRGLWRRYVHLGLMYARKEVMDLCGVGDSSELRGLSERMTLPSKEVLETKIDMPPWFCYRQVLNRSIVPEREVRRKAH
jgi:hypothetical protein